MATPEEETAEQMSREALEQQETPRERMRNSLRRGVDSRREGREQRSAARKEKRAERQDTRKERKTDRQEERTAAKLAYSEARESGKGVVPAMRDRRQEKMRQRLENLRAREQPVAPPATDDEAISYMDPMLETRAYPQRMFEQPAPLHEFHPRMRRNPSGKSVYEIAGEAGLLDAPQPAPQPAPRGKRWDPALVRTSDMTPEQIAEMEAEVARTSRPGNHPAHQYGMDRQSGEPVSPTRYRKR